MKNIWILILALGFLNCSTKKAIEIQFTNDLDVKRKDALITFSKSELKELGMDFSQDVWPIFLTDQGEVVPYQFYDQDEDGEWDELLLVMDFDANEVVNLELKSLPQSELPEGKNRTQVYLGHRPDRKGDFHPITETIRPEDHLPDNPPYLYQFEGPGWESDLVAFRTYFDSRNGKDIFGKTTHDLVLQNVGTGENYHKLQDWGMDILKVGKSLGAGALGFWKNNKAHRLGETQQSSFKLLNNGPIKSDFQLIYEGWEIDGETYKLIEHISITAGKRYYHSEISLEPLNEHDTLVTGIVNFGNQPVFEGAKGDNHYFLATHGKQSDNKDYLGMAIFTNTEHLAGTLYLEDFEEGISNTNLIKLIPHNQKIQFYFYAGWELENPKFKEGEYLLDQLEKEIIEIENPIIKKSN